MVANESLTAKPEDLPMLFPVPGSTTYSGLPYL